MQAGDTVTLYVKRRTAMDQPAYSRSSTDFVVSCNGALVTISNFTEIGVPAGSLDCWYSFDVTDDDEAGQRLYAIEPAQNAYATDVLDPTDYGGEVENYDNDALAALMLQQQGVPGVRSAEDSDLGQIVDGDSFKSDTLTMPAGKLSPFSITDISAAGIAVEAAIMDAVGGTSIPITATVVSGTDLTFTIGWDTQQHAALTTQNEKTWYIDVQVIKTGPPKQIITTNRYKFTQVWQRETRTS